MPPRRAEYSAKFDSTPVSVVSGQQSLLNVDAIGGLILGNSNKATFSASLFDVAPTTTSWNAMTIEQPASPTKVIQIKRVIIWNPGKFTTAQTTVFSLIRTSTASSVGDAALAPLARDSADTVTATGRTGPTTTVTLGSTGVTAAQFGVYSPTAVAAASPVIIDLTNDGLTKGIVIPKTALAGVDVRIVGATGGTTVSFTVVWTEE